MPPWGAHAGSDRRRLLSMQRVLDEEHPAWLPLPADVREEARAALRILCAE